MKIILLQDIKGLGKKYDVKQVKDGYARNFLLPRKLAKIATAQAIKELERQKIKLEQQEREIKAKLEKLAADLKNQEFKFNIKTGKKGEIFGSLSKENIKESLIEKGIKAEVLLDKSLKTLGEHQVSINLDMGVETKIKVVLEPE